MPAGLAVGQSGGVTPVLNSSLAGVISAAIASPQIGPIYGMRHGLRGLLADDLVRLDTLPDATLARLRCTPGAWLGSCRFAPTDAELEAIVNVLVQRELRYLIYIGGNDSAQSSGRLQAIAQHAGRDLVIVNVPKTIDNDLPAMDHSPGYASAAGFVALSTQLLCLDTRAMRQEEPLRVIEVKGRYSGWLAAAAAAFADDRDGSPLLVDLPERPFDPGRLVSAAERALARHGWAVAVVSEHLSAADGSAIGERTDVAVDAFGHRDSSGPGALVQHLLAGELRRRCRLEVLGALQKTALLPACELDRREAWDAGKHAVHAALAGWRASCVTLERTAGEPYGVRFGVVPLDQIAGAERLLPESFIAAGKIGTAYGPSAAFRAWLRPLLAELRPQVERLLGLDAAEEMTW